MAERGSMAGSWAKAEDSYAVPCMPGKERREEEGNKDRQTDRQRGRETEFSKE